MWQRQMFLFSIFVLLARSKAASESRFNGDTSGREREEELNNDEQQLQVNLNAWQPLRGHNNWLILQATAATSMHRHQQQQKEREREREREQQQQEKEQQRHQHPVNYYAYNHRYNPRSNLDNAVGTGGNYKQVRPDLYNSPSYVLAISQTMRRGSSSSSSTSGMGGIGGLPAEIESESLRRQLTPPAMKDVQEVDMRGGQEVRRADDFVALTNARADDAVNGLAKPSAAAVLEVDNYLAPFEQAVVKVRNFCETLRSLISADDDETMEMEMEPDTKTEEEKEEEEAQQHQQLARLPGNAVAVAVAANATNKLDDFASWATSKEVQGRNIRLAASSPPNQGRKLKKLKKKIQKLLLPLLIAYKLKFLTLIPVLIGGLTLLVGTTGLAGFFFALFTAVMSLKTGAGHGSKSIVLKKI